ncbi:hypothetical protein BDN70DRAFT_870730 [Pholiota conissans]|uniref:SGF29 C-terminal domain-containing protein n=1 Tax=Pholiota conissans TaxID=109636 RepID=A0A9P5ZFR6_9AGAR|nr:hypothetical protein BDN70DRAFT_870730 [Pholiota conissans]
MDSRRRNGQSRPISSEEVDCWGHATASLKVLSGIYAKGATVETIARVNRLISAWPSDDNLPTEGLASLRSSQGRLSSGLVDIAEYAKKEVEALDGAIERVGVLIALRNASEGPADKRNKRPRAPSPSGTPVPQPASGNARSMSITVPPRTNSVGPTSNLRDSKMKKDSVLVHRHPLPLHRKVAFRPPKSASAEEGAWIYSQITRISNSGKEGIKYEVQDLEPPEEVGQAPPMYSTSPKWIIPLPEEGASIGSPAHLSRYPTFPVGATVLALYPDTSCFYPAHVVTPPQVDKSTLSKFTPMYKVRFEEDDDQEHSISAYFVIQYPSHLLNPPKQSSK